MSDEQIVDSPIETATEEQTPEVVETETVETEETPAEAPEQESEKFFQTKYQETVEEVKLLKEQAAAQAKAFKLVDKPKVEDKPTTAPPPQETQPDAYDMYSAEGQQKFLSDVVKNVTSATSQQYSQIQEEARMQQEQTKAAETLNTYARKFEIDDAVLDKAYSELNEVLTNPHKAVSWMIDHIEMTHRADAFKAKIAEDAAKSAEKAKAANSIPQAPGDAQPPLSQTDNEKTLSQRIKERASIGGDKLSRLASQ